MPCDLNKDDVGIKFSIRYLSRGFLLKRKFSSAIFLGTKKISMNQDKP